MKDNKQEKKKRILKMIGWYIVGLFFAIIVPISINWIYEIPAPYSFLEMSWEAKDVLSFYGSLLGAVATIFALASTINFTVNNQKSERKLSIKPYLETHKYNYTEISKIPSDNVIFLNIYKGLITYQGDIPDDIKDLLVEQERIKNYITVNALAEALFNVKVDTFFKKKFVMLYEIENCGAGNAINVELKIGDMLPIQKFCITTNLPKKFVFILNDELLVNEKYELQIYITYSDIASLGKYCQEESFLFKRDGLGNLQTVQMEKDLLTAPKEI